jgi:hypothetical protein
VVTVEEKSTELTDEEIGLEYLNSIRTQVSLEPFSFDSKLNISTKAHATYLDTNNILSHYEDSDNADFYGEWPVDRSVKAEYEARYISENASAGQRTIKRAIDGLMSAIYHRFGFLNPKVNEIGIGIVGTKYVFDMSNANIRSLCQETQEERDEATEGKSTYREICLDTDKWIAVDEYDEALNLSPSVGYVVYPPSDSKDIVPVFTNETPDPLPNKEYSGNPVSVNFNPYVVDCDDISKESFSLYDENSSEDVDIYISMDKDNDPNDKFSSCDFAIFATQRLEYAHHYRADFVYNDSDGKHTIQWYFDVVNPGNVLKVTSDSEDFDIVSGGVYFVYIVPSDDEPSIGSVSYSYPSGVDIQEFTYYDSNTLKIQITGDIDDVLTIKYQDSKEVRLKIVSN